MSKYPKKFMNDTYYHASCFMPGSMTSLSCNSVSCNLLKSIFGLSCAGKSHCMELCLSNSSKKWRCSCRPLDLADTREWSKWCNLPICRERQSVSQISRKKLNLPTEQIFLTYALALLAYPFRAYSITTWQSHGTTTLSTCWIVETLGI